MVLEESMVFFWNQSENNQIILHSILVGITTHLMGGKNSHKSKLIAVVESDKRLFQEAAIFVFKGQRIYISLINQILWKVC